MGSLKLPNQFLLILEESNPEERLNKVIELVDNDNIGKDENKLKETLSHIAAFEGFEDIVEELIKRKVQLDYRCDKVLTPLHLAIQNNHFKIVKTFVKYGVYVNEFSLIRPLQILKVTKNLSRSPLLSLLFITRSSEL